MGAKHSSESRSVSLDNLTPAASVIDVSDEVVQRLKRGITKQARETASATAAPPKQETPRAVPVTSAPPAAAAKPIAPAPRAPSIVYQSPASPAYVPPSGATMTALDMRRQKEIELQQNDAMWRQRMAQLEQTLNKTNVVLEKEYSAAVEDVRKRFATAAPAHQLPPCQTLKAQVIACYRAHPGETLKCAEEVAAFRDCVSVNRIKKLDGEAEQKEKAAATASKPPTAA